MAAILAAILAAPGCGGGSPGIRAEVSPHVATVVKVSWTTGEPTTGYVEYGPTRDLGMRTPLEPTAVKEHAVTVLGLHAETEYFFRVVTAEGTTTVSTSSIATLRTNPLPLGLPQLTVTGTGLDGYVVVPILGATRAALILDKDGQIVWYRCITKNLQGKQDCQPEFPAGEEPPAQSRLEAYRVRLSRDGKSVLYSAAKVSGDPSPVSELVRVSLEGVEIETIPIPLLAHDFVEHADGTLAALAFEYRDFEGMPLKGSALIEIAPGGSKRTVWTSWTCFDPAVVQGEDFRTLGWTFANAVDYDAAADAYYISLRNFGSIAKVNRTTGACEWVLGAGGNTFTFAPGSVRFLHQHQFDVHGNKILVMDNDGMGGRTSRLVEYDLDFTAMLATQSWTYIANPAVYTFVLGEPSRLSDGRTFVTWSTAGQQELLAADGTQVWKLNTSAGVVFGFHTLARDLYAPAGGEPF
jgi:arylsulfate sulfotransferase